MEYQELLNFYTQLSDLSAAGKEQEAAELIGKRFSELPQDVQGEILTRMYARALEEQTEEIGTIADIQEKGLAVLDSLEILKKEL
jgi:hypothetical protein